ncbi:MAG TPA: hypothetical protein VF472_14380 [Burkholderiaceae bacterium]
MTPQGHARIFVSIWEGKVEIEGSEEFVASHLVPLQGVINEMSQAAEEPAGRAAASSAISATASATTSPAKAQQDPAALERFARLFNVANDGEIAILKDLPGNNMAHKTVGAALLIGYANSLLGSEHTPLEAIRKVCKDQACHDPNNFSATLKREKEWFQHSGRSYITLSETGKQMAQNLAEQLIGAQH